MCQNYTPKDIDRFWSKVDRSGGDNSCWIWLKGRTYNGYGRVQWVGKTKRANRVAWTVTFGDIPDGLFVCHKCDNPPCCNPSHLFLGTRQENFDDMRKKERLVLLSGENNGRCKLTDQEVLEIRSRYATGHENQKTLAIAFGVSDAHISDLINYKKRQTC